jgi:hypothetical protein
MTSSYRIRDTGTLIKNIGRLEKLQEYYQTLCL